MEAPIIQFTVSVRGHAKLSGRDLLRYEFRSDDHVRISIARDLQGGRSAPESSHRSTGDYGTERMTTSNLE